ncbi:sensor histidine kinase [Kitasatospora sp. NPDC096147]|uniref:sensor histidine kinase n=1 Tax=Kitasatospora sp. NPDC096147 TaxID=3364093 RepID=UPI0037FA2644
MTLAGPGRAGPGRAGDVDEERSGDVNGATTTGRWRQVWRMLRPEEGPVAVPSARSRRLDLALALVLTAIALVAATHFPVDGPIRIGPHDAFGVPGPPELPPGWEPEQPTPATRWLLPVLSALPLAERRRWPLSVFALVLLAVLLLGSQTSWVNVLCCVLAAYGAVRHSRHRVPAVAVLLAGAVVSGVVLREAEPVLPGWSSPAVVLLAAGVAASLVRYWQRRLAAGRLREAELRRAQQEATRRAVAEERARIAAELHDVVAHHVSVMVIQAGAARTVLGRAPEQAREALLAVESGGRSALAELRHVMGLLAAPEHERAEGLEPQPGLAQLGALTERVAAAGLPVRITVDLPAEPLPPGLELTVYRVVQEGLTNALRHAPGSRARVSVSTTGADRPEQADRADRADRAQQTDRADGGWLAVEVTDTGRPGGTAAPAGPAATEGSGRGLIGLRERIALYDGELAASPTPDGGFRVTARLPLPRTTR